jgi:hypothetical protein
MLHSLGLVGVGMMRGREWGSLEVRWAGFEMMIEWLIGLV